MTRIVPIRDLKNTSEISQMCHEAGEPIFITKNGYGDMVLMSMKVYEEKISMLDIYAKLAAAEKEIEEGKVSEAKGSLAKLREKYNV